MKFIVVVHHTVAIDHEVEAETAEEAEENWRDGQVIATEGVRVEVADSYKSPHIN